jgi:hypothetical protein
VLMRARSPRTEIERAQSPRVEIESARMEIEGRKCRVTAGPPGGPALDSPAGPDPTAILPRAGYAPAAAQGAGGAPRVRLRAKRADGGRRRGSTREAGICQLSVCSGHIQSAIAAVHGAGPDF